MVDCWERSANWKSLFQSIRYPTKISGSCLYKSIRYTICGVDNWISALHSPGRESFSGLGKDGWRMTPPDNCIWPFETNKKNNSALHQDCHYYSHVDIAHCIFNAEIQSEHGVKHYYGWSPITTSENSLKGLYSQPMTRKWIRQLINPITHYHSTEF